MGARFEASPIIIQQTSGKHLGSRDNDDLVERAKQGDYIREKMKTGEFDDFDIVANMYNGVYGKRAANMKDILRGVTEGRVEKWMKRFGLPIGEGFDAEVMRLADAVNDIPAEFEVFEADVAFDRAMKDIKNEEGDTRDARTSQAIHQLQKDNERIASEKKRRLHEATEYFAEKFRIPVDLRPDFHALADTFFPQAWAKEFLRNERKMAEVLELLNTLERYGIDEFRHVIDAAGGAGDLGVALAEKYPNLRARVVDVSEGLGDYVRYLSRNGLDITTRDRVAFELSPLQEIEVLADEAKDTAIVAKHPCGGLKDEIINVAAREGVPFLCIMSCCQDKMALHPEVYAKYYGMEHDVPGFVHLAKRSARTNVDPEEFRDDPRMYEKKRAERADGFAAMNELDRRSVDRIRALGYEVTLEVSGNPRIKKGNIIVARRRA